MSVPELQSTVGYTVAWALTPDEIERPRIESFASLESIVAKFADMDEKWSPTVIDIQRQTTVVYTEAVNPSLLGLAKGVTV